MANYTARAFIRMALERSKAVQPGAYIEDQEASSALVDLNMLMRGLTEASGAVLNRQAVYSLSDSARETITIGLTGSGGSVDIAMDYIPNTVLALMYSTDGDEWVSIPQVQYVDLATTGYDTDSGCYPECFWYNPAAAPAVGNAAVVQLPGMSPVLKWKLVLPDDSTDMTLDSIVPVSGIYQEYLLYKLAASLADVYGVDPTPMNNRAQKAWNMALRMSVRVPESVQQDDRYNIYTNQGE